MDSQPIDIMEVPLTRTHAILAKLKTAMTNAPKWIGIYLGLCGLWGFSCFILEEAQQTAMFSVWQAVPCEEWRLVKNSMSTMEAARKTMLFVNNAGGQINPFAYLSYQAYGDASKNYIDSLRARILANAPELFDGEVVTMPFKPYEIEPADGYFIAKNGKISVLSVDEKIAPVISGKIQVINDKIVIDLRNK